ncbi:MAG: hypothetical protein Q9167_004579 [Letrouitia subvulpina]
MSGTSNVGGRGVYEAGDQRNYKDSEVNEADRYKEGKQNSHLANDSKDERSIANKLAREEKVGHVTHKAPGFADFLMFSARRNQSQSARKQQIHKQIQRSLKHGNEPSKGAKIDAEIQKEEEEILKKKGVK